MLQVIIISLHFINYNAICELLIFTTSRTIFPPVFQLSSIPGLKIKYRFGKFCILLSLQVTSLFISLYQYYVKYQFWLAV